MSIRLPGILVFILLLTAPGWSQPGSIEGTEIELENLFVDASREKLLGNSEEAMRIYRKILDKDVENPAAAYELARLLAAAENMEDALAFAKMATKNDPENEWYQIFLADIYQQTGQFRAGATIYRNLRRQAPQKRDYYYKEAFFLVRANELKEAQNVYSALEDRIGVSEELIRRRHSLYLGSGDLKKAARELQKLTEAYPDNTDYLHLLADFYQKTGSEKDARKVYETILEIDPDNAKAQLALAEGSTRKSDDLAYLEALRPVFEDPGTDLDLKIGRLMPILEQVSETGDEALADATLRLTRILEETHPAQAKPLAAAGDLYYLSNRARPAAVKYTKALELDDSNFLLWENLFAALQASGQWNDLITWSEEAMFVFPNQALVYYMNGYALQATGQNNDALEVLNEALFMSGESKLLQQYIISTIGMTYENLGNPQEADDAFAKAIEINPATPLPQARYAMALAERGDEQALAFAKKAAQNNTDDPETLHAIARTYYLNDDLKEAGKWMERLLTGPGSTHPAYLEHYGDYLYKDGQPEQALRYWNQAQELGRDTDLLRRKISDKKLYE